jgi:hypothetical protein
MQMVDPGAAQAIVKQLNRWYRRRARPHGTIDHYHRGMRMSYTSVYRNAICLFSLLMLSVAGALYFVPSITADKSPLLVLALKIGWLGIVAVAILAPLQAFREYSVVTDDGLIKSDLFGRETRLAWREISTYQIKPDDNKVIFRTTAKAKLTMSLAYDGWEDFQELAAKRLHPWVYMQFIHTLANLKADRPVQHPRRKIFSGKWFSFERGRHNARAEAARKG